ncbi:ribonuclease III [Horticoccus sp. 23ND18S-11]|uniref:ribonuclease III n=1 Tax=Horticoccus sp. 23ND18S-11 TaxID=3391832 RepID=UPI0039C9EAB7
MNDALDQLEIRIDHVFRQRALLERAVTHPSLLQDRPDLVESNQRLEFLGDAVLQLILTETLFELFPGDREGVLSKRRSALANGVFLARLAREIGLERALQLGASEEATGGRARAGALEDAFEAMIGAIFLDSNFETTRRIVLGLYGPLPERLAIVEDVENPKGRLQERVQPTHGNTALRYEVLGVQGEDHAREYEVAVFLHDRQLGSGRGSSKKQAEEAAARAGLAALPEE